MPDASTGGTGDRGNTRSPGTASANDIAPGDVRIDVTDSGIATFTTSGGNMLTERIAELRVEGDTVRYIGMGGYSWSVSRTWRSGDTVSDATITWSAANGRYARGEYVAAPVTAGTCDCDMCVRSRAQWVNVGTAVTVNTGTVTAGRGNVYMHPRLLTEEQRVRAERLRLLQQRQQRERADRERIAWKERADAANARAEETLRMVLKPDELRNYDKTETIVITGSDGRRYCIMQGIVGNVMLLDAHGNPAASLCCHPDLYPGAEQSTPLPYKDAHIAQILYLRYDLDKFWQTANISWHSIDARNEYLDRRRSRVDSLAGRIFRGQW